jgi:D-arabinose 1-dehydrogenase-like Zn-dependent alcohol dehydrogenase
MKRTKAAVLEATGGSLQLAELDIEEPSANEVAIRVVACGLCHSDHSCVHGIVRAPLPVVLGHEGGGCRRGGGRRSDSPEGRRPRHRRADAGLRMARGEGARSVITFGLTARS